MKTEQELKILYDQLLNCVTFEYLRDCLNHLKDEENLSGNMKFKKVAKKLSTLITHKKQVGHQNIKFSDISFHHKIKNLSNITFTEEEIGLLNLGLKFTVNKISDITSVDFSSY